MSSSSTPKSGWSTPSWACTAGEVRPILRPTTVAPAATRRGDAGPLDGVRRGGVVTDQVADGCAGGAVVLGEGEAFGRLLGHRQVVGVVTTTLCGAPDARGLTVTFR